MKWVAIALLRAYQWLVSPLLGPACRYVPSCSEYAVEAVARYGVIKGGWKAAWRLARCHPFARGGFDPVVSCQLSVSSCHREHAPEGRRTSSYDRNPAPCASAPVLTTDNLQLTTDN